MSQPSPLIQAYLQFTGGPLAGQTIPLGEHPAWIGRNAGCSIIIPHPSIQPWHARLAWDNGYLLIQGYQQSFITLNQREITGTAYIKPGDEVGLGQAGVTFRLLPGPGAAAQPAQQQSDSEITLSVKREASWPPQDASSTVPQQAEATATVQSEGATSTPAPAQTGDAFHTPAQFSGPISTPTPAQSSGIFNTPSQAGGTFSPPPQSGVFAPFPQSSSGAISQPPQQAFPPPSAQLSALAQTPAVPGPLPQSAAIPAREITRYLCAAAHLDEKFRKFVFRHIVEEEHKAVNETHGIDIIPVVKWCFAAQKRTLIRDGILTGVFLLTLLLIGLALRNLFVLFSTPPFAVGYSIIPIIAALISPGFLVTLLFILLLHFLLVTLIVAAIRYFRPSLPKAPLYLIGYLLSFWSTLLPAFLIAWIVLTTEKVVTWYGSAIRRLVKGNFRPDAIQERLEPALEQKLRAAFAAQERNVIVYSGRSNSPFAGAGIRYGGRFFTVDVSKGKRQDDQALSPQPFRMDELYAALTDATVTADLAQLGKIEIEDKLFVNGQSIRDDRRFLAAPLARPFPRIDPSLLKTFIENPAQDIHYYKCIRLTSRQEDLVLSIFLRTVMVGKKLFIEADYLLLPPLREEYYQIDTVPSTPDVGAIWKLARESFVPAFLLLFAAPVRLLSWLLHKPLAQWRTSREAQTIQENPAFDYGTDTNLRQVASSSAYREFFQRADNEMQLKVIERLLLERMVSFLDEKHIDTTGLNERQAATYGDAALMTGSAVSAHLLHSAYSG